MLLLFKEGGGHLLGSWLGSCERGKVLKLAPCDQQCIWKGADAAMGLARLCSTTTLGLLLLQLALCDTHTARQLKPRPALKLKEVTRTAPMRAQKGSRGTVSSTRGNRRSALAAW